MYMGAVSNSNNTQHVLICVVGNMVYMGAVSNSNNTLHVLICVVDNMVYIGQSAIATIHSMC